MTDASNRHDAYTTAQTSMQVIRAIANYCGRADQSGKDWKCKCPICGRHSLSITHGVKVPILIRCWHCESNGLNDGHSEQRKIFIDAGLLEPAQEYKRLSAKEYEEYCAEKRAAAQRLWERLSPVRQGYEAAKYLKARGLESFIGHRALRTMGAMHPSGVPCLVLAARLIHVNFGICAVQFTYLKSDGSDRDRELEPGRQTFGAMKGGAVWVGRPQLHEEVVVAEGLESCLSAMLLLKLKCGATVCGPHMKELVLPRNVRHVHRIEQPEAVELTEDAQANAFIDNTDDNLRYVEANDQWYVHRPENNCWKELSRLTVIQLARLMNRGTALTLEEKLLKRKLSTRGFAVSVELLSRGDKRCLLGIEELDKDPWLLGTPDGIIDLQTGRYIAMGLRPYVTMNAAVAPADVANEKTCPLFLRFMDEFTCGDAELKRYLLQYAGYCLTGDMREQCLIFLFGDGDNGKTVFIQLLRNLLKDYAINAAVDLFVTTSIGKHATGFADLHRRRCVITNETQEGQTLRLDKIKQITGQDPMRANFMRKDNFEFRPVCKLIMFGNHKPNLPDVGKAVKKRIRMVPCNLRLKEGQMDRDLPAKLLAEGPGILRALIDGCLDWQKHGLVTPECVDEQTENYFSAQDVRKQWYTPGWRA